MFKIDFFDSVVSAHFVKYSLIKALRIDGNAVDSPTRHYFKLFRVDSVRSARLYAKFARRIFSEERKQSVKSFGGYRCRRSSAEINIFYFDIFLRDKPFHREYFPFQRIQIRLDVFFQTFNFSARKGAVAAPAQAKRYSNVNIRFVVFRRPKPILLPQNSVNQFDFRFGNVKKTPESLFVVSVFGGQFAGEFCRSDSRERSPRKLGGSKQLQAIVYAQFGVSFLLSFQNQKIIGLYGKNIFGNHSAALGSIPPTARFKTQIVSKPRVLAFVGKRDVRVCKKQTDNLCQIRRILLVACPKQNFFHLFLLKADR